MTIRLEKAIEKLNSMSHDEYKAFVEKHTNIAQETRTKLIENALFCINTLGQDINTIVFVVNGIKIKATDLLDNT